VNKLKALHLMRGFFMRAIFIFKQIGVLGITSYAYYK